MPGADRQRRLRVLAIDDDRDLRGLYRTVLEEEGHEVRLASNGLEGLRDLAWSPDLILLDLMMPVMDGYEFLEKLRASAAGADVPVLVLSAALPRGQTTLRGAQAVLRKPFDFGRLLDAVERYSVQLTRQVSPA